MALWVKFTYKFHIILLLCDITFHKKHLDNRKVSIQVFFGICFLITQQKKMPYTFALPKAYKLKMGVFA